MAHVLRTGRFSGSRRNAGHRYGGKQAAAFDRRQAVMQVPVENVDSRSQRMIDTRKLLSVIEDIVDVVDHGVRIEAGRNIRRARR